MLEALLEKIMCGDNRDGGFAGYSLMVTQALREPQETGFGSLIVEVNFCSS